MPLLNFSVRPGLEKSPVLGKGVSLQTVVRRKKEF